MVSSSKGYVKFAYCTLSPMRGLLDAKGLKEFMRNSKSFIIASRL
jgi:hypothetical protein